jgi:serine/threonine protein kinase
MTSLAKRAWLSDGHRPLAWPLLLADARKCSMSFPFDAGYVIAGKYELVRRIGRGSMGEVWAAYHRSLFDEVAIKLLCGVSMGGGEDPSTAAVRFRFEAQVAARLSRKTRHIVRVTDHGEEAGLAYLVMELLDGQTLGARLLGGGCLGLRETGNVIRQIARGLEEAHRAGVVHRDLKPANVFLAHGEDREDLVKVLDFGIARTIHTVRMAPTFVTGEGLVFGTPGYMSPEQAIPGSRLDERCDLWALSTIAYEALTGELPVAGAHTEELMGNLIAGRIVPIRERKPELPSALSSFFEAAFARNIDDRFTSAQELVRRFESALSTNEGAGLRIARGQTLQGSTLPITFPMRGRQPGGRSEQRQGHRNTPSRIAVALSFAGMLFGMTAVAATWCAVGVRRVGLSARPASCATVQAVTAPAATPPPPAPEAPSDENAAIQAPKLRTSMSSLARVHAAPSAAASAAASAWPAELKGVPSASTPVPSPRASRAGDKSNVL